MIFVAGRSNRQGTRLDVGRGSNIRSPDGRGCDLRGGRIARSGVCAGGDVRGNVAGRYAAASSGTGNGAEIDVMFARELAHRG